MSEVNTEKYLEKRKLSDIASIKPGVNVPAEMMGFGIPYVTVKDVYENRFVVTETLSKANIDERYFGSHQLFDRDILLAKSSVKREGIGYGCLMDNPSGVVIPSGFTVRIRSNHEICDPEFLFYQLRSDKVRRWILNNAQASALTNLNSDIVNSIPIDLLPLPEQKKIASILTSVDEVIENTQSQIDKLQDLKKGTMNELLTKGIGHTEFKDSELGRIPKSWEVKRLIDLSVNGISNGVFNDPKKVGGGYKLINVTEMYQKFGFDEYKLKRISLDEKEFLKNKINYGDILFTRSSLVLEGIAHCNICLSHSDDITYDGHLMRVRPNKSIIDPVFLAYFAIINISRTFFMRMAKQSTMTTIGQEDIAPLPVLVPPLEEQIKIVSIISQMTKQSINLQKKLHQTKSLKKSLMQDLLTGRVRVSVS